jgi:D-beta-D-heptose 7-phosphate kinase/D-beta-D-heptose 1-phosphate adenosyltransferase
MFDVTVMALGDVMLDRYGHGRVRRISPEVPVPVVGFVREDRTSGGAGNVAATLAGFGCRVILAGLVGADPEEGQLRETQLAKGVERLALLQGAGLTTISKPRLLSDTQQQQPRTVKGDDEIKVHYLRSWSAPC